MDAGSIETRANAPNSERASRGPENLVSSFIDRTPSSFSLDSLFSRRRIARRRDIKIGISEKYVPLDVYASDDYSAVGFACLSGNCAHLHKKSVKSRSSQRMREREGEKKREGERLHTIVRGEMS